MNNEFLGEKLSEMSDTELEFLATNAVKELFRRELERSRLKRLTVDRKTELFSKETDRKFYKYLPDFKYEDYLNKKACYGPNSWFYNSITSSVWYFTFNWYECTAKKEEKAYLRKEKSTIVEKSKNSILGNNKTILSEENT